MDALATLNKPFLSCNICTDIIKDPCTIGCLHTFCRRCLTKYTKSRRDAITAKSILCPNCNQMTKVPRPQEPVDQWCQQFKPSFLIQGLLGTFTSQESSASGPIENGCFTCQQTQAESVCEDCNIMFCDACAEVHVATPMTADHSFSPLSAIPRFKKRKVMCREHSSQLELFCKDCKIAICNKCSIVYHRQCYSVVTLDSMILKMKQVIQSNYNYISYHLQQRGNALKSSRSEVEDLTQHKSSLQSEIRRVSQKAVDVIRRKEKKLLNELDDMTEKKIEKLRVQIKSGEIDLQTYQQHTEFIKPVLQSDSPMDLYDMYTMFQSGEITAEVPRNDKQGDRSNTVLFENQLDVHQLDRILQLGILKFMNDRSLQDTPRLLATINIKTNKDKRTPYPIDIEVLNIGGRATLVVIDNNNSSIMSCYTKGCKPRCRSLKLDKRPRTLTKLSQYRVAVSHLSHNSIELIKLTPDPVQVSSIKTKKEYRCLTALSDTTLAAGCLDPPSIDVLGLSGRVLRSVITPSSGQQLIQTPRYMCTTRQGHIVVVDGESGTVYCVTQQGEVLYTHKLTVNYLRCGVLGLTASDTGSVIVADYWSNKIIQLTETGEYVRDLLTGQDGVHSPRGIRVHGNKLFVTDTFRGNVKIFQM